MRTVAWCAGGVLVAAVLFAPVIGGGWCADAPLAEASYCETWTRSVVGIDTSIWLWLGATAVLVAGA